jgi:hypothetical protein
LGWTIASAVAQNKKKAAAKKRRAQLIRESEGVKEDVDPHIAPAEPIVTVAMGAVGADPIDRVADQHEHLKSLRARRIERLKQRMGLTSPKKPPGIAGASLKVPVSPKPDPPPLDAPDETGDPFDSSPESQMTGLPQWKVQDMTSERFRAIQKAIASPRALQEAFILKELLDPPLALRKPTA